MGKQVAVKVSRVKLLEKLKQTHLKATNEELAYKIACENIDKLEEKQNANVIKQLAKADVSIRNTTSRYERERNIVEFSITATFPSSMFPKVEYPARGENYYVNTDELGNIIKLLELSNEENVSTSTYGNVARFL
jgi:hypothetical protein